MRLTFFAAIVGLVATPAMAQTLNVFHVYTDRTSFTSRGFLSGNAGETLQGYPGEQYRGIGDVGTVPKRCKVHALGMITQDQNRGTVEKFAVVFRSAADSGGPDGSAGGVIAKTSKLNLPTLTGSSPVAWSVTVNLGSEGVSVPCKDTFFAGIALDPNSSWTSDGQSTWASAYTNPASTSGDPVRGGAPNHAWQVDAMGAVRNTNPRSWNYNLQTERGAFQIGVLQSATGSGLYGNCGNYPDADVHGLAFRLRDKISADDVAAVFVSTDLIGGMPIPFDGTLWVNPGTFVLVASGKLSATGALELKPAAFGPGKLKDLKGLGNLPFQGVILDVGEGRLNIRTMNAQATNL